MYELISYKVLQESDELIKVQNKVKQVSKQNFERTERTHKLHDQKKGIFFFKPMEYLN